MIPEVRSEKLPEPEDTAFDLPARHHWSLDLMIQLFKTKPLGAIGVVLVLAMAFVAVFAPYLANFDPNEIIGKVDRDLHSGLHSNGILAQDRQSFTTRSHPRRA